MILPTIAFYVFSVILLLSAAMVVTGRNPVHSVLFLILTFFNAAALFLLAGAEFLAMILIIVYVGAVAVLFLFVVMMLDVNFVELREGFQRYAPVGATVGAVLLIELGLIVTGWHVAPVATSLRLHPMAPGISNTEALGRVLYTQNVLLFQLAGLVLLVAMIGAIVLTLRDRRASRKQVVSVQGARHVSETLVLVDMALGAGVEEQDIRRPRATEPPEIAEENAELAHPPGGH